jgi:CRP-like cAMP-binding protein
LGAINCVEFSAPYIGGISVIALSKSASTLPRTSLHLCEDLGESNTTPNLLAGLSDDETSQIFAVSAVQTFSAGSTVFQQGDHHDGIFIILAGRVRIYYTGPSGREITLAYWSPGNFIGGPEIFGGSLHMWSGQAHRPTQVLHVPGGELLRLIEHLPRLAIALIGALVHKGKCFSGLIQMLGTRSAMERLAQLLVLMADLDGRQTPQGVTIVRTLSQEDLAKMIGSTRQWISVTLDRFHESGLVDITPHRILIPDVERLRRLGI